MPKTRKKSNDVGKTRDAVQQLLKEATKFKKIIAKKLKTESDNLAEHRVYCTYIRRIMEIHKTMIQAQSIDHELLLIAALKCVVLTLIEKGETRAAEVVGNYLEDIGENVRERWRDCKEPGKAIMKSELSFNPRLPPLEAPRPSKSENASNEP